MFVLRFPTSIRSEPRSMSEFIWIEQSIDRGRRETYHVVFFRVKCPRLCFIYPVMLGAHNL